MGGLRTTLDRAAASRPALTAGLALAAGQVLGIELARLGGPAGLGVPGSGAGAAGAVHVDWAGLAACLALVAVAASVRWRSAAWLASGLLAVAAGRAAAPVATVSSAHLATTSSAPTEATSRVEAVLGGDASGAGAPRNRSGARGGTLEGPVSGRVVVRGGRVTLAADPHHPWLLDFDGPTPRHGSAVVLLPPGERRAFALGPAAGPARRRGEVLGVHRVAVDELILVDEPRRSLPTRGESGGGGLRGRLVERCRVLGLTGERGLAPALLVGDRSDLDRGAADLFTRTGTRHLLALSGLHVGLLAAVVLRPLGLVAAWLAVLAGVGPARSRLVGDLARAGWLVGFASIAGAAPPIVRAALALAAALLARHLPGPPGAPWRGRSAEGLSIWGAALSLECAADPRAVASLSVALSFAATLGILLAARHLGRGLASSGGVERRTRQVLRWHRPLPLLAGAIVLDRLARSLRTGVACSVAAVVATLPIGLNAFGEVAPVGIVATLVSVPIVGLLLPLLWLAIATGAQVVVDGVIGLESLLITILEAFDRLPWTPWLALERPRWLPWVATISLLLSACAAGGRGRRIGAAVGVAALVLLVTPLRGAPRGLEIVAIDVGHGTAVALRTPAGEAWIFDAGSRDRPRLISEALAPLLRRWEVQGADVCFSHSDWDHRSAAEWIATRLEPARHLGWIQDESAARPPLHLDLPGHVAGRAVLDLDSDLRLTLLRGAPGVGNEGSRSLLVEWRGRRVLLCGDAVDDGLAASLAAGHLAGPLDLLLLPHHGSHGEAVGALLDRTGPREIWVSGAARPAMAAELDHRGLEWRSTGAQGPLRAVFESGAIPSDNHRPVGD